MRLIRNHDIPRDAWLELLRNSDFSSPFQSPDFFDFHHGINGYEGEAFAVERNGVLVSLVVVSLQRESGIKSFFSRRGIIQGGPLLTDLSSANFLLLSVAKALKRKVIYLESRNLTNYESYKECFQSCGWEYLPWLNYQVSCIDFQAVKKNMSASRLRQVKKSISLGTEWRESNSVNDLKRFYEILRILYSTKVKKPLPPFEYFESLMSKNLAKFLFVFIGEELIGGIVCPVFENKAIYELYICGLDYEYRENYPSVLATYAAIDWGSRLGLKYFDFMGAGALGESYGVREFKARFGGVEVEYGRFHWVASPFLYAVGKFGMKLLSKLR